MSAKHLYNDITELKRKIPVIHFLIHNDVCLPVRVQLGQRRWLVRHVVRGQHGGWN